MPKTRPFKELRDKMSPERRAENKKLAHEILAELPLHELRKALSLTQVQIAETLNVAQPSIAKIENQTDMYVSTLKRFIAAMGGELKVIASFPQGEIEISQFSGGDEEKEAA